MPEIVAVPSPLSAKVTRAGRVPLSLSDAAGNASVVTVSVPESPVVKAAGEGPALRRLADGHVAAEKCL